MGLSWIVLQRYPDNSVSSLVIMIISPYFHFLQEPKTNVTNVAYIVNSTSSKYAFGVDADDTRGSFALFVGVLLMSIGTTCFVK